MRCLRVAILDDHPVTVIGLATCLSQDARIEVVLTETSADRFLESLAQLRCDVAIVDYNLPDAACDGMSLIRRIRRRASKMAVVALSADPARSTAYPAFRAGACGYLSKADPEPLIRDMVHAAAQQPRQFHLSIGGRIRPGRPDDVAAQLSATETEVLRHISQGLSVTQAARRLSRSKKTISSHKRRAMRKLGLADDLALGLYLKKRFESWLPG
ncbi:response regulator transcription factor [Bordetella sp. FB-8]|uniref:response regulator transcription factor n=1 Tax=Bordetella sp. FB-8 TaxID=1159870 RepID=UPI0003A2CA91|nr:response regulator transcription factor [Bordetella sp. FB-8]